MYQVTSSYEHSLAGQGFYLKGCNGSVTMDQGVLGSKGLRKFEEEIKAVKETIQAKVDAYNKSLTHFKKENPDKITKIKDEDGKETENVDLSPELRGELETLNKEIKEINAKPFVVQIGDDQIKALKFVIDNAIKSVYVLIQKSNDTKLEKDEKVANLAEFQWLQGFAEDLENAEKTKKEA